MNLSKNTIGILVDMIENKLAVMQIGDREELREVITLQRCLSELKTLSDKTEGPMSDKKPCGRRRKLADMMEEYAAEKDTRRLA